MKITRTNNIKNKNLSIIYDWFSFVVFSLFEFIHYKHYEQKWNGKRRLTTIEIYGIRKALVDDVGQRKRVEFYWKIGKYYI